jgi:hypothetical protein
MMDVFYYWKNFDEDIKEKNLGWLPSERPKLAGMRSRSPDYLWVCKTPKGKKGQLQLLARLKWTDKPAISLPKITAASIAYYDPYSPESVYFPESGSSEAIDAFSLLFKRYFPQAFKGNFQGDNGIHAFEADFLFHLNKLVREMPTEPFRNLIQAHDEEEVKEEE